MPNNGTLSPGNTGFAGIPNKPFKNLTNEIPSVNNGFSQAMRFAVAAPRTAPMNQTGPDPILRDIALQMITNRSGASLAKYIKKLELEGRKLDFLTIVSICQEIQRINITYQKEAGHEPLKLQCQPHPEGTGTIELCFRPLETFADRTLITIQIRKDKSVSLIHSDNAGKIFVDTILP